ncbi:MAG: hypothetical protein ACTTIZ_04315 [Treponema sp.]
MSVLIALLFPLIAMLYTIVVHKKDFSIASYISGIISGLCSIPFCLMLKMEFYTSSNFLLYSFSFFFFYFLLPSVFGLLAYYLFNFKSFEVKTLAVALSGIWTVFLFFSVYEFVTIPTNIIYVILILSYATSVLFFDFVVTVFSFLSIIPRLLLTYALSLSFSFVSCLSFAFWLFKYSALFYIGLPVIVISILFIFMLILTHSKKNSAGDALLD